MKKKIIFVHGFGVRKDSRGMFTQIANHLNDYEPIIFDLNEIKENDNNIYLNPLSVQANILTCIYEKESSGAQIFLICHSQGCVVASLANLQNVEKTIFLAPSPVNDVNSSVASFRKREGTVINFEGESILMRRDGSKTIVPKIYWEDRKGLVFLDLYKKYAEKNKLTIIKAKQEDVVSKDEKGELKNICDVIEIDGNHNFDGDENRKTLIETIKNVFE